MTSRSAEVEAMSTRRLLPWTLALSFLVHGVAYASLHAPPPARKAEHHQSQLRFDVVSKPAPPPPQEAPLPPEPPRSPPRPAAPKPVPERVAKAEPAPPAEPARSTAPTDGVTLAAGVNGNGFSMPLGTGGSLTPDAPPRTPAPVNVPAPPPPAPRAVTEPPVVALGDLSSRPSAPSLADALERNYPAEARQRGLSGSSKVRARIDADGVVRRVTLLEESGAGFGSACRQALSGSRWAPPKDKAGRPVATEIRYTCRFVTQ